MISKALFVLLVAFSLAGHAEARTLLHKAAFVEDWSRYPTPDSILAQLVQSFPSTSSAPANCSTINEENRLLLGDSMPASGVPAIANPNSSFANWYMNCIVQFIQTDRSYAGRSEYRMVQGVRTLVTLSETDLIEYWGQEAMDICLYKDPPTSIYLGNAEKISSIMNGCSWLKLNMKARMEIAKKLLHRFIGPADVITDLGIANSEDELAKILVDQVDEFTQKPDARYDSLLKDDFSTVDLGKSVQILEFLINLIDFMKY
jgi:hypothetical protein